MSKEGYGENTVQVPAAACANVEGTCSQIDTDLTQQDSLDVPVKKFADHSMIAWGFTYFVKRDNLIKIGHTGAPKQRLSSLGKPLDVLAVIPNTIIDEPTAHKKFAHLRVDGEWFHAAPELLEFVETLKRQAAAIEYPSIQPPNQYIQELRRHLKMRHLIAAPILRPFLSTLEQQLKSWDAGGNRVHLAGNIERTIRAIENLRQLNGEMP